MLSQQEIEKIKEGMFRISKEIPGADLEMIINTFNSVFGCKLSNDDKKLAEYIIEQEWRKILT